MKVTKLAWVEAARSLNRKRMIRSASTIPVSSQTACSARKLYAGRSVVTVVVLFSRACCIPNVTLKLTSSCGRLSSAPILQVQVSAGPANRLAQHVDSLVELGVLDQNRWQEPDDGPPGGQDEDSVLLHRLDHRGHRLLELDGLHHASAANLANLRQVEVANPLLKTLSRLGRAGVQRLVRQHPQGRGAGGADQRIAGERTPMAPLGNPVAHRLGRDGDAKWQDR